MNPNFFEQDYLIHYYETAQRQELRITNLMNYFEEVALMQSEERKVGLNYYQKNNVGWMLHKWDITIQRNPVFGQQILVRTLPVSMVGFMGFRKFWVFDSSGKTMITAKSAWIFVNTLYKRPIRVSEEMKRAYRTVTQPEEKLEIPDVPALQKADFSREFFVRQADIDINQHVNNVRYLDWALEALPPEMKMDHQIENIGIVFKKETTYGQMINSQVELREEDGVLNSVHRILDDRGREACALMIRWQHAVPA
ncbi:MAG: acyl-ACP thioesterase domain-containing protein [Bacteroides sp.]|jgi:medium-chain acyl-[acyl-carrier-protein] hydrolase|nr:acyl-ACP thioesterase domain-containing protein [Bacteroides sp.]